MSQITSQPTSEVSAYRPILFRVTSSPSPSAQPIERMQVEVWDSSISAIAATFFRDPVSQSGGVNTTSVFEFDAADFVRSRIAPWPDRSAGVFLQAGEFKKYATDGVFRFHCKFRFLKRNASNLLEDMGDEEQSAPVVAFNTIYQHRDAHSLAPYLNSTGRKLLTDSPNAIPITTTDRHGVCFIASGTIDTARFQFTQTNGIQDFALLNIAPVVPPLTITTNRMIHCVGVGGANLLGTTAADWLVNDFYPDETTVEYTVDFGSVVSGNFVAKTQSVRFVMQHACGQLRLHWLNSRGGTDSHTFDAERKTVFATKSEQTARPLAWQNAFAPIDRQGRGTSKANIKSVESWEVESRILDTTLAAYVARALESSECYIEFPGETALYPCLISDTKEVTDSTMSVGEVLSFTVTPANERITHTI